MSGRTTKIKRCAWVEEVDKGEDIPAAGRCGDSSDIKNSTGVGVKGRMQTPSFGFGDSV